jgi:hypothetical protein
MSVSHVLFTQRENEWNDCFEVFERSFKGCDDVPLAYMGLLTKLAQPPQVVSSVILELVEIDFFEFDLLDLILILAVPFFTKGPDILKILNLLVHSV